MKKETNVSPEAIASNKIVTAEPPQWTTSFSEEEQCEGEVEKDLTDALHQSDSSPQGTPPSNTVPYNCNTDYFKLLRFGIDSLYLSYQGELFPEVKERLTKLKQLAQHPEADQQAQAQYAIAGHIFEVMDRGSSIFPFIMEDGAFRISLSRTSKKTPMAYVKLSSRYLCNITPIEAETQLRHILSELGILSDYAHVSRIDLCADFVSHENMESWGREAWIARGKKIDAHAVNEKFTGWSIGLGGKISCRLYNKLIEIYSSGRTDLIPLWKEAGWIEGEPVWRVEFQLMRDVLAEHGLISLGSVLANLNGLWSYASTEWLRLTLPNPDDQTRSRWPIHPLWGYVSSIDWETNLNTLSRSFQATRLPDDKRILALGISSMASFMAKHAITDFDEGLGRYLLAIHQHLHASGEFIGLSAEDMILEKVRLRGKEFNTILNINEAEQKRLVIERAAKVYRKAKDGE
ncbi:replication initiation factor [Nitrosomonas supralitoralis]|uniref:Replication initiation factor n=1 Tax=Nitrosomonas supralitoralis TaxID=2116706 RepID=A0A2P7NXH8_9PROT|nr:replication initiation factor [Nitrosomonas supralitoralis]PSJ18145.1 replication initiation factor [Nitrosomonas supralitoralis]